MNNKLDWIEDCYQTYNEGNWITKRIFKKVAVTKGDHHHCLIDAKKLSFYDYPGSKVTVQQMAEYGSVKNVTILYANLDVN